MFKLQLTQYRYKDNLNVLLVLQVYPTLITARLIKFITSVYNNNYDLTSRSRSRMIWILINRSVSLQHST